MVISRKLIKPLHPPLEMNSQIRQQGTNHKHVELFFSNNGLWHDHIDYIVKKAYTRLNMLRKVRFITDAWGMDFVSSSPLFSTTPLFSKFSYKSFLFQNFHNHSFFLHLTISVDVIHHE